MKHLKHIPALDGVRGLAILLVMMGHLLWLPSIPGLTMVSDLGWTGVDLFFVLSGFLITGILDDARGSEHALKFFYFRRMLRIFPLYYAYLLFYYLVVVRFHWINFDATRAADASHELPWLWFYGTNFLIAKEGHFITASLNHFWTLAIEEHFYLFWPALVLMAGRRRSLIACGWIVAQVFVLRIVLVLVFHANPFAVHVLTPCRIDSFAVGGALALAFRQWPELIQNEKIFRRGFWCATVGFFIFFICANGAYTDPRTQTVGYTVLAVFFASLIGRVMVETQARAATFTQYFDQRWLRWLGKYSYALYVIHHPLHIAVQRLAPRFFVITAIVEILESVFVLLLSLVLAKLSWELFEKRFIRLKHYFE